MLADDTQDILFIEFSKHLFRYIMQIIYDNKV